MTFHQKKDLSLRELQYLDLEMRKRGKSRESMWALWAFLSYFGAHRYFLGDFGYATAMFLTSFLPMVGVLVISLMDLDLGSGLPRVLFFFFIFWLGASVLWSWIDSFFINARFDSLEQRIEAEIIDQIRSHR